MTDFKKNDFIDKIPSVLSLRFDFSDGSYITDIYVMNRTERIELFNQFFGIERTIFRYSDYYEFIGNLIIDVTENESNKFKKTNEIINQT